MIEKRIICISGFMQRLYTPNGMEKLWLRLREEAESVYCCVSLHPWNTNWKQFVQHILRTGPVERTSLDIRVAAYSWGCGYGLVNLSKELHKNGVYIKTAVLSDPVYHNNWTLWRSLWSPILGQPKVYIPENVLEVYYFRQKEERPYGCQCVAEDFEQTKIVDCGYLRNIHTRMDDATDFHNKACEKILV